MQRRPKVFVPNKGGHDYTPAQIFGDVIFITEGTVNKFAIDVFYRQAAEAMRDCQEGDYLLIASLNTMCSICAAIMARKFSKIRFLLFRRDKYIERLVDIDNLIDTGNNNEVL